MINSFQEQQAPSLSLTSIRNPVITELETAILNARPLNTMHFIKNWALKQLNQNTGEQEEIEQEMKLKNSQKNNLDKHYRRRGAIRMFKTQICPSLVRFYNKDQLKKSQASKSQIMFALKNMCLLSTLGWQKIQTIAQQAEVCEYNKNEIVVKKGEQIDIMFLVISGQLSSSGKPKILLGENQVIYPQTLISRCVANVQWQVSSDKAWLCPLDSYRLQQSVLAINRQKQQHRDKLLMRVSLFSSLDTQERYKLILMLQEQTYKPSDIVIQKGQPVRNIFLIISGEVSFSKVSLEGTLTSFQTHKEGSVFGENWFVEPSEAQFTVIVNQPTVIGSIERKQFEASIVSLDLLQRRRRNFKQSL